VGLLDALVAIEATAGKDPIDCKLIERLIQPATQMVLGRIQDDILTSVEQ
jgi:hypothetical protein